MFIRPLIKDLVSLVIPCYNTSEYIHSLLDSILEQDYPNMEIIIVNDGSTDNTLEIIESYTQKFKNKGYREFIITQKNAGQSAAIKKGLEYINGEYFVWPDSDDYYLTSNAISKMVEVFKNGDDKLGMVRTREALIEDHGKYAIGCYGDKLEGLQKTPQIFLDCLLMQNGFYYTPGAYMVKTEYLFNSICDFYVHKDAGQNAQIMFPILYNYNCFTIPEIHYCVREREQSHSRKINGDFLRTLKQFNVYEKTNKQTLKNIKNITKDDLTKYIELNSYNYDIRYLYLSCIYNNTTYAKRIVKKLHSRGVELPKNLIIRYILMRIKILPLYYNLKNLISGRR